MIGPMDIKRAQQSAFSAAKWMTGSSYVTFITSFINSVFVTRGLGPAAYGVYSYLIWMVSFSVSLTTGGLNITAIRFISEAIGEDNLPLANGIMQRLRKMLWIGMALMALALTATALAPGMYPMEVSQRLYLHLAFAVVCAMLRSVYLFEISVSKGYSIFQTEALTVSAIGLLGTVLTGLFYLTHQPLDAYLLLFLVAAAAHPIIVVVLMRRAGIRADDSALPPEHQAKLNGALRWNTALSLVGMLSSKSIDTYLMGLQSLTVYIGYYNIASALAKSGIDLLTNGFSSMLLPFISRARAEGGDAKVQEIFSASVRFYQFMGTLVGAGGYLMGELLVHTIYGKAYDEVIPALQVMAIVGGMTMSAASYSAVFIATDSHQARLRIIFFGSGISLATACIFIPWLGYHGALLSCAVGNSLYVLTMGIVAHRSLGIRFPARNILLQLLAAFLALGIVEVLLHDPSSLIRSIAATLLFGVLFVVISVNNGSWERSDLDMLRQNSRALGRLLDVIQLRR